MKVTACVVSYNTAEHLPGALESLLAQTHPDLHVVVVDNDSNDGSADVARRYGDVEVIANRINNGFAGGANQGIARATDGAFFVLNPDVRLAPDHIANAVAAMQDDDRIAAVQGRLWRMSEADHAQPAMVDGHRMIDTTGHTAHTNRVFRNRGGGEPDDGRYDDPADIFGISGCAGLYRLDALHDVAVDGEVYDEDLFAFFEDVDLDWRLKARGWRTRYTPDATGLHERGGQFARRSRFVERLSYRNWFLVVLKNDDPLSLLRQGHLFAATTWLRTVDIAVTVPSAFALAVADDIRMGPAFLRKRAAIDARRTVDNADIVDEWFGDFDYRAWFAERFGRSTLGRKLHTTR